jgi:hypothetical protein
MGLEASFAVVSRFFMQLKFFLFFLLQIADLLLVIKFWNTLCSSVTYAQFIFHFSLWYKELKLSHYTPRRRLGEGIAPTHSRPRH